MNRHTRRALTRTLRANARLAARVTVAAAARRAKRKLPPFENEVSALYAVEQQGRRMLSKHDYARLHAMTSAQRARVGAPSDVA